MKRICDMKIIKGTYRIKADEEHEWDEYIKKKGDTSKIHRMKEIQNKGNKWHKQQMGCK